MFEGQETLHCHSQPSRETGYRDFDCPEPSVDSAGKDCVVGRWGLRPGTAANRLVLLPSPTNVLGPQAGKQRLLTAIKVQSPLIHPVCTGVVQQAR